MPPRARCQPTRKSIALPLSTFTAFRLEADVSSPIGSVRPDWRIEGRRIRMRRGHSRRRAKMLADAHRYQS